LKTEKQESDAKESLKNYSVKDACVGALKIYNNVWPFRAQALEKVKRLVFGAGQKGFEFSRVT